MLRAYFTERATVLGYSGSLGVWLSEHYEVTTGILLSLGMVITSIISHFLKIRKALNDEKRSQELHDLKKKNLKV